MLSVLSLLVFESSNSKPQHILVSWSIKRFKERKIIESIYYWRTLYFFFTHQLLALVMHMCLIALVCQSDMFCTFKLRRRVDWFKISTPTYLFCWHKENVYRIYPPNNVPYVLCRYKFTLFNELYFLVSGGTVWIGMHLNY